MPWRAIISTVYFPFFGNRRSGQSLIEVLVAVALGALMLVSATVIIAPVLKIGTQTNRVQIGTALARELLDNVRAWSEGDWHYMSNLATSSQNRYYLSTSSSPFVSVTGTESIVLSTTTYTRCFYVEDVFRDAGGSITASGGSLDPSTKKVTVAYSWAGVATSTVSMYLTRNRNNVFDQTDWSGGPDQSGPVTSTNSMFATSSNILYTTTTGSLYINIPGY